MDMKYDCDLIKDLLPLYSDKEASEFSMKVVSEHLHECEECLQYYQNVKNTTDKYSQAPSVSDVPDGYLTLAKRLRRTKWYWRLCTGFLVGLIISFSLMYAEGNRLNPLRAAHAGSVVSQNARLLATVPMRKERVLYIYEDNGLYRDVDVIYNFPFWKYVNKWPNRYIVDPEAGIQMLTKASYRNSLTDSLYLVFAIAVNDTRVAYVELGKEGKLQRQNVDSQVTVFFWDESGNKDDSSIMSNIIKDSELEGKAYASDGTILYNLRQDSDVTVGDSITWISTE